MKIENETLNLTDTQTTIAAETLLIAAGEVEEETLILDGGNSTI